MGKNKLTLAFILILCSVLGRSQHLATNRYVIGPGEYNTFAVDNSNHRLYQLYNYPHSFVAAGLPDSFATCAGGAHWAIFITVGGNVWTWGDSSISTPTPARVTVDSLGNSFGNVVKVGSGGTAGSEPWNFYALKSDGTLWIWKYTNIGVRGNGTNGGYSSLPVQIPFPTGTFITDAIVSFHGLALDSAGNVWTWGADAGFYAPYLLGQNCGSCAQPYTYAHTPTKITLPTRCKMISGGSALMDYFLLTNGQLYATAWDIGYIGLQKYSGHSDMSYNSFLPIRVDTALNLPVPIDTLMQTTLGEYAILTDSTLWFWGSNACGNSGMGAGLDMRHYSGANGYAPYAYDQNLGQALTGSGINGQALPIHCMPGMHSFTKIFGSTGVDYYTSACNKNDSIFFTGRNKYGVIPNNKGYTDDTTAEQMGNIYPNGLDVNYWTYTNLWASTSVIRMSCKLCLDSPAANLCSSNPVNTSGSAPVPTIKIGKRNNHYELQGLSGISSPATGEHDVLWTGDALSQLPMRANDTVAIYNPTVGKHTIQWTVTDNNYKQTTISTDIYVGWTRRRVGYHHYR